MKFARHPFVYLVEAADDICYEIMDIEDAHKLKILNSADTRELQCINEGDCGNTERLEEKLCRKKLL